MVNDMKLVIPAMSENEALARAVSGAFAARLNPTLAEIEDVRTAVSEAVTNAIIHGYEGMENGEIELYAVIEQRRLMVQISDFGRGIENVAQARTPFYTSRPELERSGMGFTIMESFMDEVEVISEPGEGTMIRMYKNFPETGERDHGV